MAETSLVPGRWVPLEPTPEMQRAYMDSIDKHLPRVETDPTFGRFDNHRIAYRAMLNAAPLAPSGDDRKLLEEECADVDTLLKQLGLDMEECRTDGGRLRISHIAEKLAAEIAVGRIVSRPYRCGFCMDRLKSALAVHDQGAEAFLRAAINYHGMLCGSAEWMVDEARAAIRARDAAPPAARSSNW
jgi:hypothetical protein